MVTDDSLEFCSIHSIPIFLTVPRLHFNFLDVISSYKILLGLGCTNQLAAHTKKIVFLIFLMSWDSVDPVWLCL